MEPDRRPDPDTLLERIQEEERKAQRGKLRIFFGASAGVGKTFAMLLAPACHECITALPTDEIGTRT